MTFVTEIEQNSVVADVVFQCWKAGDNDGSTADFDEPFSMQPAKIAGDQFTDGTQAGRQFFVVFGQFEFNTGGGAAAVFLRESGKMGDQPSAHGGKGKLFHQAAHAPQAVSKYLDDL